MFSLVWIGTAAYLHVPLALSAFDVVDMKLFKICGARSHSPCVHMTYGMEKKEIPSCKFKRFPKIFIFVVLISHKKITIQNVDGKNYVFDLAPNMTCNYIIQATYARPDSDSNSGSSSDTD